MVLHHPYLLTSTPRSLVSPAPHSIGQALDVGRTNTAVSRVAGENNFSSVLVVWTIDNPPSPMVQREGAQTGARQHWKETTKKNQLFNPERTVSFGFLKWTNLLLICKLFLQLQRQNLLHNPSYTDTTVANLKQCKKKKKINQWKKMFNLWSQIKSKGVSTCFFFSLCNTHTLSGINSTEIKVVNHTLSWLSNLVDLEYKTLTPVCCRFLLGYYSPSHSSVSSHSSKF